MRLVAGLVLSVALSGTSSAASITLNPGVGSSSLSSIAFDGSGSTSDSVSPTTLPYADSTFASDGTQVSDTSYDLSDAAFDIRFDNHERA